MDNLIDPITYELFVDPVTLPQCGHTFSRAALKEGLQAGEEKCPMCRVDLTGLDVDGLPRNVALAALVEAERLKLGNDLPKGHVWKATVNPVHGSSVAKLTLEIEKARFQNSRSAFTCVVDRSGSMSGKPYEQVISSLVHIVSMAEQNPMVRIDVIAYDSYAAILQLPGDLPGKVEAIRKSFTGGGTNFRAAYTEMAKLFEGLKAAGIRNVTVCFMTDGESGEKPQDLIDLLRTTIQPFREMDITIHTVGFGRCDQVLLDGMRLTGTREGMFRFADHNDDGDALCNKIAGIYQISAQGSVAEIQLHLDGKNCFLDGTSEQKTSISVNELHRGRTSTWIKLHDDVSRVVKINSSRDQSTRVNMEVVEDDSASQEWLRTQIDRVAERVLTMVGQEFSEDLRVLQCCLLIKQLSELSIHVQDDRVEPLIAQISAYSRKEALDMGRLRDMRFGSYFHSVPKVAATVHAVRPNTQPKAAPLEQKKIEWSEKPVRYAKTLESRNELQKAIMDMELCPYASGMGDLAKDYDSRNLADEYKGVHMDADAFHADENGNTAFHLAAYRGQFITMKWLLDRNPGVDLDIYNKDNETPVTLAIKARGYDKTMQLLLDAGASIPRKKNMKQFAQANGYTRTVAIVGVHGDISTDVDLSMTGEMVQVIYERAVAKNLKWNPRAYLEVALFHRNEKIARASLDAGAYPELKWVAEYCIPPKADHPETDSYLRCLQIVLRHCPDMVKSVDDEGNTLLIKATEKCSLPHVKLLVDSGSDVEHANELGNTALWIAAMKRHVPTIEYLIDECGANVTHVNKKGNSALYPVCQYGPFAVAELLVAAGVPLDTKNNNGDTLLLISTRNGQWEILKLLMSYPTQELIEFRAHIDGFDCVLAAAEQNRPECIRVLHEHGCSLSSPTSDDNEILKRATPLHISTYYGNVEAAEKLLDLGVPVDAVNLDGMTSLHLAALKTQPRLVRLLLARGANIQVQDNMGNTAVMYCGNNKELRDILIDPLIESLIKLARGGFAGTDEEKAYEALRDLGRLDGCYEYDKVINMRNELGSTALIEAIVYTNQKGVEFLLEHGANTDLVDNAGMSADLWAHWINQPRIKALLPLKHKEQFDRLQSCKQRRMIFMGGLRKYEDPIKSSLGLRIGYRMLPECKLIQEVPEKLPSVIGDVFSSKRFAATAVASDKTMGCSVQELMAINWFMTENASWIYETGAAVLNDERLLALKVVFAALEKLPSLQTECYSISTSERWLPGKVVSFSGFHSGTSLWPRAVSLCQDWPKKNTVLILQSKTGRFAGSFSSTPYDCEVIWLPGTKWKVTRWLRADQIALGQPNVRSFTFGVKEQDLQTYADSDKGLIVEMEEVQKFIFQQRVNLHQKKRSATCQPFCQSTHGPMRPMSSKNLREIQKPIQL